MKALGGRRKWLTEIDKLTLNENSVVYIDAYYFYYFSLFLSSSLLFLYVTEKHILKLHTKKETDLQINRLSDKQTYRQTYLQTNRVTDIQTYRQTDL